MVGPIRSYRDEPNTVFSKYRGQEGLTLIIIPSKILIISLKHLRSLTSCRNFVAVLGLHLFGPIHTSFFWPQSVQGVQGCHWYLLLEARVLRAEYSCLGFSCTWLFPSKAGFSGDLVEALQTLTQIIVQTLVTGRVNCLNTVTKLTLK